MNTIVWMLSLQLIITALNCVLGEISVYVCRMPLCICVYCTVAQMCPCCLCPRCPCIQIDAADLIKPVGLHVECQHCHQAQWEPNGGIGGIDPVDSTESTQIPQSEASPIEGNDPQMGPPARREGEVAAGSVEAQKRRWGGVRNQRGRDGGCETLKYQRDPGRGRKCWRNKLLLRRVGSILCPFGSFSAPS